MPTPTTRIYLIRHAQAETNLQPERVAGLSPEALLTEGGERQGPRLGVNMAKHGLLPEVAYSSKTIRGRRTGELVLSTLSFNAVPLIEDRRLNEMSQGGWEGKPKKGLYTEQLLEGLRKNGRESKMSHPAGDGESKVEVAERMLAILNEVKDVHKGKQIMMVTHRIALACLVAELQNWPEEADDYTKFTTFADVFDNATMTRIDYDEDGWDIKYKGRHLDGPGQPV